MFFVSVWLKGCLNALNFTCDYLTYNTKYNDLLLWYDGIIVGTILLSDIQYFSVLDNSVSESEL